MRARCGWQAAEAGSRRGLGLSSAVRYALPGTGRCQLCPGQDGGYRDVGTLQSPPSIPLAWAEAWYRLTAPAAASRKDLVVLFRTRVVQLFQVIVVVFFFPGIYPQKLAVPNTLQEPGRPCPGAEAMLQHHQHPPYSIPHPLPCRDAGHHLHRSDGPELILHPITQTFLHPTSCHSSAQIRPLLQIPEPPEQAEHSC